MPVSWLAAIFLVLGAAALHISTGLVTAALALCGAWALIGPRQALQSLALAAVISYWNPELATFGPASGILERLVLVLAALRVLPLLGTAGWKMVWPVWLFSLCAALTSAIASVALSISIMKVITFVIAVSTVLVGFSALSPRDLARMRNWLFTLALVIVALSALTLLKPAVGYALNGRGLQGVLSHPQSLGALLAPFAAWMIAGLLVARDRFKLVTAVIAAGFVIIIFLTQARTAAVAILVGVLAAVLTRLLRARQGQQAPIWQMTAIAGVAAVGLVVAALHSGEFTTALSKFVFKRVTDTSVSEAFMDSRGGGMVSQWANFVSAPLTGHGFGVYADGSFPSGVSEFAGIPISAPVEKGFVPTAVLEETGAVGGLLFYFAIFWLGREAWRSTDLRWAAMFASAIGVSTGEAVILSPGGVGLVIWLVIGLTCSAYRIQESPSRVRNPAAKALGRPAASAASGALVT